LFPRQNRLHLGIPNDAGGRTMTDLAEISFARSDRVPRGTVVVPIAEGLKVGPRARKLGYDRILRKAAQPGDFKAKLASTLDVLAPKSGLARLVAVGVGKPSAYSEQDRLRIGGAIAAVIGQGREATVVLENPDGSILSPDAAADVALGASLRSYVFDKYRPTRNGANEGRKGPTRIVFAVADPVAAQAAWKARAAVAAGVALARDLVNEPPNVLGTLEFAETAAALAKAGVAVDVLTEKEMKKLGMGALLGVAQGSLRPPRIVVMRWNGGGKEKPIAFIGKGVVFDSGGISIKPGAGMEDMKGDMGGAAAVTGLMQVLATRKARVNAVGIVGLVENMPDGGAQRPGDIVTAMSGRTIEIVNTDAEGRLVLADLLHYAETKLKPRFLIDLATLTGAVMVALGHHHAGLFSNDDSLSDQLVAAGNATGEKVWRLPLGPEYDKLIDSRFADVKNSGGRIAGSITGAQFLKRFVGDTPWVHLDIAGTAMDSPQTEINRSWASGWGVRLLDRLVADNYESKPLK
jgi:leucyl aminopeptidase